MGLEDLVKGVDLDAEGGALVGGDGVRVLEDLGVDGHLEVEGAAVGDADSARGVHATRGAALPARPHAVRQLVAAVFGAGRADEVDSVGSAHGGGCGEV